MNDWRDQAACVSVDPDMFFDPDRDDEARAVCNRCAVREACLAWAVETKHRHSFAGGKTARQRRRLRAARGVVTGDTTASTPRDREYWERLATAGKLAADGATPTQVAEALGIAVRTAQRLVKTAREELA